MSCLLSTSGREYVANCVAPARPPAGREQRAAQAPQPQRSRTLTLAGHVWGSLELERGECAPGGRRGEQWMVALPGVRSTALHSRHGIAWWALPGRRAASPGVCGRSACVCGCHAYERQRRGEALREARTTLPAPHTVLQLPNPHSGSRHVSIRAAADPRRWDPQTRPARPSSGMCERPAPHPAGASRARIVWRRAGMRRQSRAGCASAFVNIQTTHSRSRRASAHA